MHCECGFPLYFLIFFVSETICDECGQYLAAKNHPSEHVKKVHGETRKPKKFRPKAILKERAEEVLCVFDYGEEGEDVMWLERNDVEDCDSFGEQTTETDEGFNVVSSIAEWLRSPWEEKVEKDSIF